LQVDGRNFVPVNVRNRVPAHRSIILVRMTAEPSAWVARHVSLVPAGGPVLDLAAGNGRHARLFLDRGHPVTAVDVDASRLGALRGRAGLTVVEADLEAGAWPLPGARFAGVVVTNYLWRPLLATIVAAVADGGCLIYATFGVGHERHGRPRRPEFLLRPGELLAAAGAELQVVRYECGLDPGPEPRVRQRIVAVRGDGAVPLV
jgi:SAM-dependent methyltransferase